MHDFICAIIFFFLLGNVTGDVFRNYHLNVTNVVTRE